MGIKMQLADSGYAGGGYTLKRETGKTPGCNDISHRWVLRKDGEWLDMSAWRNDLAAIYNLDLEKVCTV